MVEAFEIQHKAETRFYAGRPKRRNVALDESHVNARRPRTFARLENRLRDHVNSGNLPASLRKPYRPDSGAASEVERLPIRRLASVLLTIEERRDLFSSRGYMITF
jgi:hypothetical protein